MKSKINIYYIYRQFSMTVFTLLLLIDPAVADGTHDVKVKILNNSTDNIQIFTYNRKDRSKNKPHKVYYISKNGSKWVEAHGQGKNRIQIKIKPSSWGGSITGCYDNNLILYNVPRKVTNNKTLKISGCGRI